MKHAGPGYREEKDNVTIELTTPSDIYERIDDELARIVISLADTSTNPELNQASETTREQLVNLQGDLQRQLSELKKNAEWDTFTVAFYGETGAGKSTLIEALRIILAEPTKRADQERFCQLKSDHEANEESLRKLQDSIQAVNGELEQLAQKFKDASQEYEQKRHDELKLIDQAHASFAAEKKKLNVVLESKERASKELMEAVDQLKEKIAERKKTEALWQKLLNLFRTLPEEEQLAEALAKLPELTSELDDAKLALNAQQAEAEKVKHELAERLSSLDAEGDDARKALLTRQREAEQNRQTHLKKERQLKDQLDAGLADLAHFADGQIIGDGRADFTRQTQRYDLSLKGNDFALLDVPGIEGKEGLVLREIERAVQTAHAVFYVTNKAAPPQTGDEERKGTLEKIKQHLGAQTEVWSIFNKKVTNPKHTLKNRPLTSEDEDESLVALEEKMQEQLGKHYQEVIALTALPAFLASTENLVPDSQDAKRRRKFLEDFTEAELIEKSRMQAFLDMLGERLLPDSNRKINRANLNKAKQALDGVIGSLDVIGKTFSELAESLAENRDSSQHQIKSSFGALQKRLDSRGEHLIREFSHSVRQDVYGLIDGDVNNEAFKSSLKEVVGERLEQLNGELPDAIGEKVGQFESEAADILKRFEEQTRELTSASEKLGETRLDQAFHLKIDIDSGVNKIALVSALIGAALAPFTGGATLWVAGGAALTAIVAVGRAVASFFSTSYKMSQQRKATDDNLRDIAAQLRKDLRASLNKAIPEMDETIQQLEKAMDVPVEQAEESEKLLRDSNKKLKILSRQIETLGAQ